MAIVGYARTSTQHQDAGRDAQLEALQGQGVEKIFSEKVSSVAERVKLDAGLAPSPIWSRSTRCWSARV
jgi:DNA invertase Pin-like site-specific DNA recombinase